MPSDSAYIPLKVTEDDGEYRDMELAGATPSNARSLLSWTRKQQGRLLILVASTLAGFTILNVFVLSASISGRGHINADEASIIAAAGAAIEIIEPVPGWPRHFNISNPLDWVNGPATNSLRENLKPGINYLTAWEQSGMTNVWMAFVNLIYLATITDRVPVVPPFVPHGGHLGKQNIPTINFGEIYDVPRLSVALRTPILEWSNVKRAAYDQPISSLTPNPEGSVVDIIGCWSIVGATHPEKGYPPMYPLLQRPLQLDIAFTSLKEDILFRTNNYHAKFWAVASVLFSGGRNAALKGGKLAVHPAPKSKATPEPDQQFACIDNTFGLGASQGYEWFEDIAPAWRLVGRHTRFTPRLEHIADGYLRRALKVADNQPIPPFVTMHIRRGDWNADCVHAKEADCRAPLWIFDKHFQEVLATMKAKYPATSLADTVPKVIVTSDEGNQTWWKEVTDKGWFFVDHNEEKTAEKYGYWYPSILDSVIQARGAAMVGTIGSTMSNVAAWRVREWNGGVSSMVSWNRGKGNKRSDRAEESLW